ncbi:hypothetical protein GFS31_19870 [Leptolyngbya sp. BL0902]|nr:hypothetical protein GFS31_19870 [Leptolyngbya sp. BL0902]
MVGCSSERDVPSTDDRWIVHHRLQDTQWSPRWQGGLGQFMGTD